MSDRLRQLFSRVHSTLGASGGMFAAIVLLQGLGGREPQLVMMQLLALVIAIPVHEFAHALSTVNNGDPGPKREGRLSILPWDHFDVMGAVFCVFSTIAGFGLGWGRPVRFNPGLFKNPKVDTAKVAAWGPTSNLLLAVLFALPFRLNLLSAGDEGLALFCYICIMVNISLMLFNLIPIGPLDGAKVVAAFLPDYQAHEFWKFQERWGTILLYGLVFFGRPILSLVLMGPMNVLVGLLLGR